MRKLAFLMLATTVLATGGVTAHAQGELQSVVELPTAGENKSLGGEHINFLHQREWVRLGSDGLIAGKLLVLVLAVNPRGELEPKSLCRETAKRF